MRSFADTRRFNTSNFTPHSSLSGHRHHDFPTLSTTCAMKADTFVRMNPTKPRKLTITYATHCIRPFITSELQQVPARTKRRPTPPSVIAYHGPLCLDGALGSLFPSKAQSANSRDCKSTSALSTGATVSSSPAPRPPRRGSGVDRRSHRWFNGGSLWHLMGSVLGTPALGRVGVDRTCHRELALLMRLRTPLASGARTSHGLPIPLASPSLRAGVL